MKNLFYVLGVILLTTSLSSCFEEECSAVEEYFAYEPVLINASDLRTDVKSSAPKALKNPGKIYVYGDLLLVNEKGEGIHVYNNADPANPIDLSFIEVPGNFDMAIRDNIIYVDNYMDLLAIDISNPANPILLQRTEDAFPNVYHTNQSGDIIVEYKQTQHKKQVECGSLNADRPWFFEGDQLFVNATMAADNSTISRSSNNGNNPLVGTGGSLARFTIMESHLYTVDERSLVSYAISGQGQVNRSGVSHIGLGIETVFPQGEYLFIGAEDGMYIYDVSNPENPVKRSKFEHVMACDPVVVKDDVAYVTLRDGNLCGNAINQLDIIDVKNPDRPKLLTSHRMSNPHGLSVYQDELIICEGAYGWKKFDLISKTDIQSTYHDNQRHTTDVIRISDDLALLVGDGGLYQYDVTNSQPKLISQILAN